MHSMTPPAPSSAAPDIGFAESSLGQSLLRVLAEGSASNRAIADYLLRNQVRVTALGIEELAEACEVSTATISRFARFLVARPDQRTEGNEGRVLGCLGDGRGLSQ